MEDDELFHQWVVVESGRELTINLYHFVSVTPIMPLDDRIGIWLVDNEEFDEETDSYTLIDPPEQSYEIYLDK